MTKRNIGDKPRNQPCIGNDDEGMDHMWKLDSYYFPADIACEKIEINPFYNDEIYDVQNSNEENWFFFFVLL